MNDQAETTADASVWQDHRRQFQQLASEEREQIRHIKHATGRGDDLRVFATFFADGRCKVASGISEDFRERVNTAITQAGISLGDPSATDPADLWIRKLFSYLREKNSKYLYEPTDDSGGIVSVCEVSATFCSWLAGRAAPRASRGTPGLDRDVLRAVTEDAIADVARWLITNPPGEQRAYALHLDKRLRAVMEAATLQGKTAVLQEIAKSKPVLKSVMKFFDSKHPRQGLEAFAELISGGSPAGPQGVTAPGGKSAMLATTGDTRQTILTPILKTKSLSVNDWAVQAGVDFHTANDYLNGKTNPHPSTLAKLALPLGMAVMDMPT